MAGPWYVDGDNGNDVNGGLSEGDAFATIQQGVDDMTSGDTVYVQNNGATVYGEQVTITDKSVVLIGYGSTVADEVKAKIDGADTRTHCILFNNTTGTPGLVLRNFELQEATSHGLYLNKVAAGGNSEHRIDNVWTHDNAGAGFNCNWNNANPLYITRCRADLNGGHGFHQDDNNGAVVFGLSTAFDNVGSGFKSDDIRAVAAGCISARNAINFDSVPTLIGCTVDASDGTDGWVVASGSTYSLAIASGFSNAAAFGIDGAVDQCSLFVCGFYTNTSGDTDGTPMIEVDSVAGSDPAYVDAANEDYALGASSPWKQQDVLVGDPDQAASTSYPDIGAVQLNVTGGGGGVIKSAGDGGGMVG